MCEKQIELPEIQSIQVKIPDVKTKKDNIDLDELTESVQQSFPFMDLLDKN